MLTLWAYVRYAEARGDGTGAQMRPNSASPVKSRYYWLALLFFAFGLMSKAMLASLPLLLLLLDWWPLGRLQMSRPFVPSRRTILWEKLPFLALGILAGLLTIHAEKGVGALPATSQFPLPDRGANAILSTVGYVAQMFWPSALVVSYPYPRSFAVGATMGAAVLLLSATFFFIWASWKRPFLVFGWFWYVVTLLPVSGLVQVGGHAHADRYTYVPLIGLFVLVTWFACEITRQWRHRLLVLSAASAVSALLCIVLTSRQLRFWKDSETLFRHAIALTSDNEIAYNNLGAWLVAQGRFAEAIPWLRQALELDAAVASVHDNLGAALVRQGALEDGIRHLQEAIKLDPRLADAQNNLGAAYGRQGRFDEAIEHLQAALELSPADADAHCNLGEALAAKERFGEAVDQYRQALKITPDDAALRSSLGIALGRLGHLEESVLQLQEALKLNPDNPQAHCSLGVILCQQGRLDEAIHQFEEALRLSPDYAEAESNLHIARQLEARSTKGTPVAPR